MALAVAASVAMVASTVVGGVLLVRSGDGGAADRASGPGASSSPGADGEGGGGAGGESGRELPADDPRAGLAARPDPVVADDWQVQVDVERNLAFDVPPGWTVEDPGTLRGFEFEDEDGEWHTFPLRPVTAYLDGFCGGASNRALAGNTGAIGATDPAAAAASQALNYVLAGFDQHQEGTRTDVSAEPFTSGQGFEGYIASSSVADVPEPADAESDGCPHVTAGTAVSVGYLDGNSDVATWLIVYDQGIDEELDQQTLDMIIDSIRWYEER